MEMRFFLRIACLLIFLSIAACSKTGNDDDKIVESSGFSLAVLNEGNYTWGNASLTLINEDSGTVQKNYFQSVNDAPLGDVAQSMLKYNDKIYIVVNNSGKIEELDTETWKRTRTLSGLISPRYILPVSESKAYVTDLYASAIHIVDMNSFTKTGSISAHGWTDEMILMDSKVWTIEVDSQKLVSVNTTTDQMEDIIELSALPNSIVETGSTDIFVLAHSSNESKSYLLKIDANNGVIEEEIEWSGACNLLRYADGYLYYFKASSKLFRASLSNLSQEEQLIDLGDRNIYGFMLSGENFYFSDAKDYARNGTVLKYSNLSNPVFVDSFIVGRIPQAMLAL
jgi:hypothetical protein